MWDRFGVGLGLILVVFRMIIGRFGDRFWIALGLNFVDFAMIVG